MIKVTHKMKKIAKKTTNLHEYVKHRHSFICNRSRYSKICAMHGAVAEWPAGTRATSFFFIHEKTNRVN